MSKEFLTISELNTLIKEVLNFGFPNVVWICGEIQNFDRNKHKNHIFFELCEKDPLSKDIVARIGLVIFGGRKSYIDEILRGSENAFQLKDDIEVKFLCKIDFYPPHGAVRLIVESIDPVYTLGKIAQERQRLIALLKQNGTLEKNKQLLFPMVPLKIGVITAYDSAAYNDFISELRASGFRFKILLRNSLMQGKNACDSVCEALQYFNRMKHLDVIVITRGGGSIAELSCFDSQLIAEKIAASRWPVISGIGHEINTTITDLAAHTYAKTPTAIAQFLVERINDFLVQMEEQEDRVFELIKQRLENEKQRLRTMAMDVHHQAIDYFKIHSQMLVRLSSALRRQPLQFLDTEKKDLNNEHSVFFKNIKNRLHGIRSDVKNYERHINLIHPKNTLKRGFTITRAEDGSLVRRVEQVSRDAKILTELVDGIIESQIEKVRKPTGRQGGDTWI